MRPPIQVLTGLSLTVGDVVVYAAIDEAAGTVQLRQLRQDGAGLSPGAAPVNGAAAALERARVLLRERIQRVRPDLQVLP